jgi:hypothetical protein
MTLHIKFKENTLNILGHDYCVDFSRTQDDIGLAGICYPGDQLIEISNDIPNDSKASTLIHEIIEAINYHLELNLDHSKICGLEIGIFQALKDSGVDLTPMFKSNSPNINIDVLYVNNIE